ncbi:MAG: type III-B CRISPR-associated protein Cas10/Cmr2 [Candidatus Binatia bacterium]
MSEAILIFTFGPVQSFIAEARRASDLYVGSQILVQLARAAAQAVEQCQGILIFPTPPLSDDVPNKLVARVPWEKAEAIAAEAKTTLLRQWTRIADTAKSNLMSKNLLPDARWHDIWARQVSNVWEIYWAAASLENRLYKDAYDEANQALDAAKRARMFNAVEEHGLKDTLSGCREALHTSNAAAKAYWTEVGEQVKAAKLKPSGHERLDAIGAIKRFSAIADESRFPSTSTVASRPFLNLVRGSKDLAEYRQAIKELLGEYLYKPNPHDADWPYDGDLFFIETLTPQRLESSYGLTAVDEEDLKITQSRIHDVYDQAKSRPSPYYAMVALDGDNMGRRIGQYLEETDPEKAHRDFSLKLATFASRVGPIIKGHYGELLYNGGDDVLAMAPLSTAFPLAQALAAKFSEIAGGTASAGIAIAHHLFPLGTALGAARQAEQQAKRVEGKNAVCVRALKRSGETLEMRSPWKAVGEIFAKMTKFFQGDTNGNLLSSKLAYDVLQAAYALPEADEKSRAELKRLLKRHRNPKHRQAPDPDVWAERLKTWATQLPDQLQELGRWLVFARFLAQGGRD